MPDVYQSLSCTSVTGTVAAVIFLSATGTLAAVLSLLQLELWLYTLTFLPHQNLLTSSPGIAIFPCHFLILYDSFVTWRAPDLLSSSRSCLQKLPSTNLAKLQGDEGQSPWGRNLLVYWLAAIATSETVRNIIRNVQVRCRGCLLIHTSR